MARQPGGILCKSEGKSLPDRKAGGGEDHDARDQW